MEKTCLNTSSSRIGVGRLIGLLATGDGSLKYRTLLVY